MNKLSKLLKIKQKQKQKQAETEKLTKKRKPTTKCKTQTIASPHVCLIAKK